MRIRDFMFTQTSSACPEQYDVFDLNGNQVAYVKLRWGHLRADYPSNGGVTVYEAGIGNDNGCFRSNGERLFHLIKIAKRIERIVEHTIACPRCGLDYVPDSDEWDTLDGMGTIDILCPQCVESYTVSLDENIITIYDDSWED